tara:strand:- start:10971 stop:11165 length:195 start_codon:yes stop_codon:yes gene_type:complete
MSNTYNRKPIHGPIKIKKRPTRKPMNKKMVDNSFKSAFKKARAEGLKTFIWNGKKYSTKTKDDK